MLKRFITLLILIISCIAVYGQVVNANYVIDYSQAVICGMDEESFSSFEQDWYKDKPEINSKLLSGILDKMVGVINFNKNSDNKVLVKVMAINDKGGFVCGIYYQDSSGNIVAKAEDVVCFKGGTWGSKLNLIKDGAEKEGVLLGKSLRKALKRKL